MSYLGLTWDHPRGFNALAAAKGPITWEVQPLEGFESAPIAELCAAYDLVVLDHPHLGEALAHDCLTPLDDILPAADLARIGGAAIGPSYASYAMAGRQWALPLDAATQVMALRPDLTDARPRTWDEVQAVSKQGGVALSLAGPHAFLSLLSISAALDVDLDMRDGGWPDPPVLEQGIEILQDLYHRSPSSVRKMNPIGILNHMSTHDDVALVPLIYGYVNYAPVTRDRPLKFLDAPRGQGRPGSILGGTGIAVSRRARVDQNLRDHLLWLLDEQTQCGFIPDHDGQPSLRNAWKDARIDAAWGRFYSGTAATLEAAAIRPRHDGYIALQGQGSACLRDALAQGIPPRDTARRLTDLFQHSITPEVRT